MPEPTIENFVAAVKTGVESWEIAGTILVALCREDKDAMPKINKVFPFLSLDSLELFFHIGTHSLYPMTLLMPRHVFSAMRQMSYENQKALCEKPVTVVSRIAGDKPVVISKPAAKLTRLEVSVALSRKGNIPEATQVKKLAHNPIPSAAWRAMDARPAERVPLPVKGGRFVVRRKAGGGFCFEPTMASPLSIQRVRLEEGQAVIELTAYQDKP